MNLGAEAAEETLRLVMNGVERTVRITGRASEEAARLLMTALRQSSASRGAQQLSGMLEKERELVIFDVYGKDLGAFASQAQGYGIPFTVLRDGTSQSAPAWILVRERDAVRTERILYEKKKSPSAREDGKAEKKERVRERILRMEKTAGTRTGRAVTAREERSQ